MSAFGHQAKWPTMISSVLGSTCVQVFILEEKGAEYVCVWRKGS